LNAAFPIVQYNPSIGQFTIDRPKVVDASAKTAPDITFRNVVTSFANPFSDTCDANICGIDEDKCDRDLKAVLERVEQGVAK